MLEFYRLGKESLQFLGVDQNYNVNYAFGNENVKAYTSLGYQNVQGIVSPSDFARTSAKS